MKRIHSLQYLRAAAALMVVGYHLHLQLTRLGYMGYWPNWLAGGVDIFFVVSGFIMWVTTADRPAAPKKFMYHRIVRIVPLYWLMTTFVLVVMLAMPSWIQTPRLSPQTAVASYLFFPSFNPIQHAFAPIVVPGWSLNFEMFFYVIFAGCLLLGRRTRLTVLVSILVLITALRLLSPPPDSAITFYSSGGAVEFALGVLLGAIYTRGVSIPAVPAVGLLLSGFVGLALSNSVGPMMIPAAALPATLIVAGPVLFERKHNVARVGLPHLLGDASYSLYLSHTILLSALVQVWHKLWPSNGLEGWIAFSLVAVLSTTVTAVLIYRIVEQPSISWLRNGIPFGRSRSASEPAR